MLARYHGPPMNRHTAKNVDAYLRGVTSDKRAALTKLRRDIRAAMPKGEECISYGIPAFRLAGRVLVFFAAASRHCSFFPGARPIADHRDALDGYETSKGTIRFSPDGPLSTALVRKLVKSRIAEHKRVQALRASARKGKPAASRR